MTPALDTPIRDKREVVQAMRQERDQLSERIRRIMAAGGIDDPLAELVALLRKRRDKLNSDIRELEDAPCS